MSQIKIIFIRGTAIYKCILTLNMTHNITKIQDILTIKGLWYERQLDNETGLYEFTGAVYLSIPSKQIIVDCNTGRHYDLNFLKECDETAKKNKDKFSRPKYIYINMYEIRQMM